ncbi:unnamed protein product [Symbiodinium microadriaticum]|nr:unnamed protein product [Symbiodinium microadriaticum]
MGDSIQPPTNAGRRNARADQPVECCSFGSPAVLLLERGFVTTAAKFCLWENGGVGSVYKDNAPAAVACASVMSQDLLVGIFSSDVPESLRKPALSNVQPSFVDYGDGCVLAKGFDNDRAIQAYEATLQDMMANGGFQNPAVGQICTGLATLYDAKAAITKDPQYYDRCVEYMSMVQQAMQAGLGEAAQYDPMYMIIEAVAGATAEGLAQEGKASGERQPGRRAPGFAEPAP